jgi:TRAP-type C4-dicarboxylate transport system substrate-binding protein
MVLQNIKNLERGKNMFSKNALKKSVFLLITIVILTACVPQASQTGLSAPAASSTQAQPTQAQPVAAQPTQTQPAVAQPTQTQPAVAQPITLSLATYDDNGAVSTPYINEFADQVKALSGGSITILPNWAADTEQNVLKAVIAGQYDLGLVASRAWDTANITSFQALQAPFLINNDALSIAVATSDIARQMLDSVSSAGIVGLTLWPEDLRHPFSVDPGKPLLSTADFTGLTMRVPPSGVSNMLIKQLGATPMYEDSGYQGAESGLTQLGTLNGRPIATGNITFYPKFQVLFANGPAFKKLNLAQQKVLSDAAAAAQKKAIAEHQSDATAGTAWCADGSSIVLASDAQIAAFQQAAQPVLDSLAKDPFNAKMIAAINDLKAKTPASPGAQACQPHAAQITPLSTASGTEVWSTGTLPNGVWTMKVTTDELVQMGLVRSVANNWYGTYHVTFQDGNFTVFGQNDQGNGGTCPGTYAIVGDFIRLTYTSDCVPEVDDLQWRLDDQGLLHIHLVNAQGVELSAITAMWEAKPWQKVQ